MTWGFIWLMFVLKIPIIGLFGLVWWAVRQQDEPAPAPRDEDPVRPVHPPTRARRPKRPRGPHGEPMPLPPSRSRPVTAYGREHADR